MKLLYVDVETTGLDPVKHDVIQLAGIIEIDGTVKEEFEFKCQPHSLENCDPQALKIHGMDIATLLSFDSPRPVLGKLQDIWGKHVDKYNKADKFVLCGQNVPFDAGFLREWFRKCGDNYFGSWVHYQYLDLLSATMLMQMAGRTPKTENYKLATVCNSLGIELQAHDALADIRATRQAMRTYIEIIAGKPTEGEIF